MLVTLALTALLTPAHAAPDCNAKQLEQAVRDAAPATMADAYIALAACDEARAKKIAETHMSRMVADNTAVPALVEAIRVGAGTAVTKYVREETPDTRSRLVNRIGKACDEAPSVGTWFVRAREELGGQFFDERWHRGLDTCRTPEVQQLLTESLTSDDLPKVGRQRTTFVSVLEVYARNLGVAAVPTITEYLTEVLDKDEEASLIIGVYANAAQVGSPDGLDEEAAKAGAEAILSVADKLPPRTIERARGTLSALGDTAGSESLAQYMWPDAMVDGTYTYGLTLTEIVTCKNDKTRVILHTGIATHPGDAWPDTLQPDAEAKALEAWAPAGDGKCKGTAEYQVAMTDIPTTAPEAIAWLDKRKADFIGAYPDAQKTWTEGHEPFAW